MVKLSILFIIHNNVIRLIRMINLNVRRQSNTSCRRKMYDCDVEICAENRYNTNKITIQILYY